MTDRSQTPLPGTQDRSRLGLSLVQQAQQRLQALLASYGYQEVEVPVLERADLYLRKLGSQVAGLMFTLTDQEGERLCLRPEFTGSVIRSYINHAQELSLPLRWQYCGPVFRDGDTRQGQLRQFTQLGAELIGGGTPRADAELLALACQGMRAIGAPSPRLVLGHAGLLPSLLAGIGLSERSQLYLANHLALVRSGPDGVEQLREGLRALQTASPDEAELPEEQAEARSAAGAAMEDTLGLLEWFVQVGATRPTGRRGPEEIISRFRAKYQATDQPQDIERALGLVQELSQVRESPNNALQAGAAIASRYGVAFPLLQELESVITTLDAFHLDGISIELDLGLIRPLGYYTGIVFELYAGDASRPVGGGGRYDELVPALGGPASVPALGFAYTLEDLLASVPGGAVASGEPASVLVVPERDSDFAEAVRQAEQLRTQGVTAVLEVELRSEAERLSYCQQAGIGRVVVVGAGRMQELSVA